MPGEVTPWAPLPPPAGPAVVPLLLAGGSWPVSTGSPSPRRSPLPSLERGDLCRRSPLSSPLCVTAWETQPRRHPGALKQEITGCRGAGHHPASPVHASLGSLCAVPSGPLPLASTSPGPGPGDQHLAQASDLPLPRRAPVNHPQPRPPGPQDPGPCQAPAQHPASNRRRDFPFLLPVGRLG